MDTLNFNEYFKNKINESDTQTQEDEMVVTIKDIIEYLQKLDGNAEVGLSHDGWSDFYDKPVNTVQELIENSGLFYYDPNDEDGPYMTINN